MTRQAAQLQVDTVDRLLEPINVLVDPVDIHDHIRGPVTAPVTLVEYGDYQCPYSAHVQPVVLAVLAARPADVRLVYRHFPLTNVHPLAELAAEAAESAGARGRFWEMHDWLYEHPERFSVEELRAVMPAMGLPVSEVAREVEEHRYLGRIRSDFVGAVRSGVSGTPTFFINGFRHNQGQTLADLLSAVDAVADLR
jgi:protein-disulfide isomerase